MNPPAPIPRLPVFGWHAFAGSDDAQTACLLDLPSLTFTTSGRASILLALEVLGVGRGDRVLLPTYHCPTMIAPATHLGAEPVFYPVDERGMPRLDWLQAQPLARVKVLLAPHYFGLPRPLQPVREWCDGHGIALIEDCAHALFGRAGARAVGAWGDVAIASLTKFMPVPIGGCLVLNRPAAVPALQASGWTTAVKHVVDMFETGAQFGQVGGLNHLLPALLSAARRLRGGRPVVPADRTEPPPGQPASGDELLIDAPLAHRRLSAPVRRVAGQARRARIVARRRDNYRWLSQALGGAAGLRPLFPELPADCAPYVFPLWVDRPDPGYLDLRRQGMPVFRWDRMWPGVPELPDDRGREWSHHVIQVACHQDLDEGHLQRLAQALKALYATPPC